MAKIAFILSLIIISNLVDIINNACLNKYLFTKNNITILKNFNNFEELNENCKNEFYFKIKSLEILPNMPIVMDNEFNFTKLGFINMMNFYNLNGIEISKKNYAFDKLGYYFNIFYSKMDFYINKTLLKPDDCKESNFKDTYNILLSFYYFYTYYYVKYPKFLCPLVFNNSNLVQIVFYGISNSLINKNLLTFINLNDSNNYDLNIEKLIDLTLYVKYETITERIINKHVFKNIKELTLYGLVYNFQTDLFKNFNKLKYVDFLFENFRQLFHNGNEWMTYLNKPVVVDLNHIKAKNVIEKLHMKIRFQYGKVFSSFNSVYDYPNEDFCLFKHFPHNHLVFPMMVPGKRIDCSCTVLWLIKYYHVYFNNIDSNRNKSDYIDNYDTKFLIEIELNKTILYCYNRDEIKKCNFEQKLLTCNLPVLVDNSFELNNDISVLYLIKWLQFILLIVLHPIFCFFGIFTNILTIIVIKHKKNAFKERMYSFIILNAVFNILYCIIIILQLVNECVSFDSPLFCSTLYQKDTLQSFKIILYHFGGNVIKTSMNISYLFFALSRLILITDKKSGAFQKFIKFDFKLFILLIEIFSILLSLFKLFQYEINDEKDPIKDFPNEIRNENYCHMKNNFECKIFNFLKLFNSFTNDILFVFLNFFLDLFLIKTIKKKMENKKKINGINNFESIEEQNKKKIKLNKMVILNLTLYLISHFPGFFVSLILIIFSDKFKNFCVFKQPCDLINEEAQFFGIISISFQFFIFYYFNNKMNKSFQEFKQKLGLFTEQKNPAC